MTRVSDLLIHLLYQWYN